MNWRSGAVLAALVATGCDKTPDAPAAASAEAIAVAERKAVADTTAAARDARAPVPGQAAN